MGETLIREDVEVVKHISWLENFHSESPSLFSETLLEITEKIDGEPKTYQMISRLVLTK